MKKNICFVTTTRAEFGLLKPLINEICMSKDYQLKLIVSGTHLSEEFGNTYLEIENTYLEIEKTYSEVESNYQIIKIDIMEKSNKINKIMSNVFDKFYSELYKINNENKIDLLILLGDRFEILAITQVAFILGIKICHLAGGDITKGAMDDQFRNAISQISDYHMPFSEESKNNLIKMNIDHEKIFLLGNPGLEDFKNFKPVIEKSNIISEYNLSEKYILCVFHPETKNYSNYIKSFFSKISNFLSKNKDISFLILKTNCDPGYLEILKEIYNSFQLNGQVKFLENLDRKKYLSIAYHSYFYIGNSSSGIYELPYLEIPIINVGNRQLGRPLSSNIIQSSFEDILDNLLQVQKNREKIISDIEFKYKIYDSKEIFIKSLDTILIF